MIMAVDDDELLIERPRTLRIEIVIIQIIVAVRYAMIQSPHHITWKHEKNRVCIKKSSA